MAVPFNDISPELKDLITPLEAGEKATYRILKAPDPKLEAIGDDRTEMRAQPIAPVTLFASVKIFDPYTRKNVTMFVEGKTATTPNGTEKPIEQEISFVNGLLQVSYGQEDLYALMELHPANRDNVNPHKTNVTPLFERVMPEKTDKSAAISFELGIKAQMELASYSYDELQRVARRLKVDATQGRDALFLSLGRLAQAEGDRVYNAIGDRAVKVESLIATALSEGVLEWVGEERMYKLKESRTAFLPIPHGDNPQEALVTEMMEPRYLKQRTMLEKLVDAKQKAKKK